MARPSRSEYTARTRLLVDELRKSIMTGHLHPGDYLPSELELGKTYGLSKESVRKALDVLVEERLIVKIPRVGNRVSVPGRAEELPEPSTKSANRPDRSDQFVSPPRASAGNNHGVVKLAYYPSLLEEARLTEAAEAFEKLNPGMQVRLIPAPFPLDYMEHGMADVATVTAWDALKLKEKDAALTALADAPHTMEAHPLLHKPFQTEDGRSKAAPFVFSPVVLCYNRSHFAEASLEEPGEDWTWYTLMKTAKSLSRQLNVSGFAAHMQSVNRWPVFLLQNGFRFRTDDGSRASDDPVLWESLRVARDLTGGETRLWTENDADVEKGFREGRVSMIMTTYFGLNRLQSGNIDYGVAMLPALRSDATLLLVTGLAVSREAVDPEAAFALVRFLCGEHIQTDIRRSTLSMPAHPAALAEREGLLGNRPALDIDADNAWSRYKLYSDLNLGTSVLEAIREELKFYWSRLEDEVEASERLVQLLGS